MYCAGVLTNAIQPKLGFNVGPNDFNKAVGEVLRNSRQQRGWTQVLVAERAGLSPNYVARLERGELCPSLFVAVKLSSALSIKLSNIVGLNLAQTRPATANARLVPAR